MYFFLGFLLFLIVLMVICRIRVLWLARKNTITEKDFKTFKEYNNIEDYEKEAKQAVYATTISKTLFEKCQCLITLRTMLESLHTDYEKYEKVNLLLMELLRKKFTFTYSAFITIYPEPIEESGLERFSLINTKNTVQNMYGNIFSNPLFIPMKNWMTILGRRNSPHWSECVQIWIYITSLKARFYLMK